MKFQPYIIVFFLSLIILSNISFFDLPLTEIPIKAIHGKRNTLEMTLMNALKPLVDDSTGPTQTSSTGPTIVSKEKMLTCSFFYSGPFIY